MRTTLDLDDRVLAAARSRARATGVTLGQAVSQLALRGYEREQGPSAEVVGDGFPMLPLVPGHVITDEMVEEALADDA
ncbi:hypothetical protein BH23ACT6_BH23ACT6_19870 [soil metagenome]